MHTAKQPFTYLIRVIYKGPERNEAQKWGKEVYQTHYLVIFKSWKFKMAYKQCSKDKMIVSPWKKKQKSYYVYTALSFI